MRRTRTMIVGRLNCLAFLVIVVLMAAICTVRIANVVDMRNLSIGESRTDALANHFYDDDDEEINVDAASHDIVIGNKLHHVMWFMQVTDLHISSFTDSGRFEQLKEFCAVNVFTIRPSVVLASGDLTDGRSANAFGSKQQEAEWRIYKDTVRKTGILQVTNWLDIRGNHDNFDVPAIDSERNLFRKYSVQGPRHSRSYSHQVVQGGDSYSFIAVDASLQPGPRRPLNFIGMLTKRDINDLAKLAIESRRSNVTIWFGHYPTSSILSPAPGIRHLMRHGYVYLCGHFHTMGGWVPRMYTMQKQGFLELELGDWKNSRIYRVAAVDHGMMSFVDVHHGSWPVVLITNPKNYRILLGDREPGHRMIRSTHIRVLVFSTVNITEVRVSLDNGFPRPCINVEGPLYVLSWNTSDYRSGVHTITAKAKDSLGRETVVAESFALDGGSRVNFDLLPRFFLMSNIVSVTQGILGVTICLLVVPLCYVRLMHHYVEVGKMARPRYRSWYVHAVMKRLWLLASVDLMFYPVVLVTIYVPLGPWFIGSILSDHLGVVFAWGIFVGDSYLPGGMTFVLAVIHLWSFNAPLMLLLATALEHRYHQLTTRGSTTGRSDFNSMFVHHLVRTFPFVVFFVFNVFLALQLNGSYGPLAFFINPLKTWSLIAALVLWLWTSRVPTEVFRSTFAVFPPNITENTSLLRFKCSGSIM